MKIESFTASSLSPRSSFARTARLWLAVAACALGAATATAQLAVSTFAGAAGTPGTTNTGTGPATLARFNNPASIVLDSTGANLYIADANNHLIRKVVVATGVTSVLAGTGSAGSADNATGTSATFRFPQGIAIDSTNANLYVADTNNHTIRRIALSGTNTVTTIAGTAGSFGTTDNATGTSATFNSPLGLVVDSTSANLYVADTGNSSIRRVILTGAFDVSTFAGTSGSAGTTDGVVGTAARFDHPSAIAADATNLYVADTNNHAIRQVVITSKAVSTLAGLIGTSGSTDNASGASARFKNPAGIVAKGANLYVADTLNNTIRQVVISGGATTTLAGSAAAASGAVDAVGTNARFSSPSGVAADGSNNLYIADTNNQTIRFGGPAAAPSIGGSGTNPTTTVGGNASIALTGVTGNPTPTYQWQVSTDGGTNWTNLTNTSPYSGVTTGTLTITGAQLSLSGYQYRCQVSNGVGSTQTSTPRTLTVQQAPTITSANNATFAVGTTGTFNVVATGTGTINYTVISGSFPSTATLGLNSGVITYTPSNTTGSPFTFTIQADNGVAPAATQSFTLTVSNSVAPSISAQPASTTTVNAGGTATFNVTASGSPSPTYQWQVSTDGGSTFNNLSNGAITGGTVSGATTNQLQIASVTTVLSGYKYQVAVTNSFGGGTTVTSTVSTLTVNSAPVITNSTTSFSLAAGQTFGGFSITTSGTPAPTSYAVSSGTLPAWASLNTSTGAVTATRATVLGDAGTSNFSLTATNSVGVSSAVGFSISVTPGPTINSGPASTSITPNTNATFTVTATANSGSLSYQWYRAAAGTGVFSQALPDNVVYFVSSSGNTSTLTISSGYTGTSMNGDQFRVVVTDGTGSTTSATATLTVLQAAAFTSLANATFSENLNSSFNVQATGSPTPSISLTSGSLPSGLSANASAGLLVISGTPGVGTSANSPYLLQFTATNAAGASTQNFTLTVLPPNTAPAFTTQPTSQNISIGQTATFTVVATGSPTPTYQWQRQPFGTSGFINLTDGGSYSGSTTATLTVSNASTGMNGDQFQCIASNLNGSTVVSTTSAIATLTVNVGTIVTTLAGSAGSIGVTDATGVAARFNNPSGIATDGNGNYYVADTVNSVVRKVTSAGVVTTLAGLAGTSGSTDGLAAAARFNGPSGVAADSNGNVYVADTFNHTIRVIANNGTVVTLAGQAGAFGASDGTGSAARFTYPTGITIGTGGVLYVADSFNHTIRQVTINGVVTTFAGLAGTRGSANGTSNIGGGQGTARFANPTSMAVDSSGSVYVADSGNHLIRKIDQFGTVTTLAGQAGIIGSADGTGTAASFNQPGSVTVDSSGNVYVADTLNHTIRKITSSGVVTTLAGLAATSGSADGTGSAARFNQPGGIVVDSAGNLYIADTKNHTIRRSGNVTAPTISTQPQNQTIGVGQNASFTVAATGAPPSFTYQWQRQPAGTTGFVNLANDGTYSGVTTATLTVSSGTIAMTGDQFQCVVSNFVSPDATTSAVTLTVAGVAPVFTSAGSATFTATQSGSFTVAASGTPAPTFSASGLPSWASINATSGVISGTAPDTSGSPFAVTLTANNGLTTTQNFTLTVVSPITTPVISAQPVAQTVNHGDTATFSVTANGTAPLNYQWSKDGVVIGGATSSTLSLTNVQTATAGNYSVAITNVAGSATSVFVPLIVNAPPVITVQPRSQTTLVGGLVIFSVAASGSPAVSYQWRLNGAPISGGNSASLAFSASGSGNYDVVVTNTLGSVTSSLAQLAVVSANSAPVITSSPANTTVLVGGLVSLSVSATGVPAPNYQWRKNGATILGATNANYIFNLAQSGDSGSYDVAVSNSVATVTSQVATVRVIARSYAGVYTGSFGGSSGSYALYVRPDNTAVLLGLLSGPAGILGTGVTVSDSGGFSFLSAAGLISGSIANSGAISGSISGGTSASLTGSKSLDLGANLGQVGFYQAGVTNGSGTAYAIVSATGQVFVLTQTGTQFDGGSATLDGANRAVVTTSTGSITATVAADGSTLTVTSIRNGATTSFSGGSEAVLAAQRLGNISTRARVDTGANIAIAGFVIAGQNAKPVLIRAIGPTLSGFGVASALASPKLELFRGNTVIASNTGWTNAGNTAAIVAATTQAGAFALPATSADSVILATLPPGAYTAQVSAASGAAGVALIEVYDLSAIAAGQKLFNISTRATAGAGDATLIAGIYVAGTAPKRVLIRAVGPGLAQFGLTGVLATPQLQLLKDGQPVASNTNVNTSPDAAAIAAASTAVGAFPLPANSADCALLVNLAPGSYSATVSGANGTSGLAIVEVYEVP